MIDDAMFVWPVRVVMVVNLLSILLCFVLSASCRRNQVDDLRHGVYTSSVNRVQGRFEFFKHIQLKNHAKV